MLVNTGLELAGKVEVETVAGPQSQRQEAIERGRTGGGRSRKTGDMMPGT